MNFVELLNTWGAAWSGFMARAFIDTAALLALIVVVWLPLRRRISAQLAHGVFCLVLLKLIVPVPVTWGVVAALGVGPASRRASLGVGDIPASRQPRP